MLDVTLVIDNLVIDNLVIDNLAIDNLVIDNLVIDNLVIDNLVIDNLVVNWCWLDVLIWASCNSQAQVRTGDHSLAITSDKQ